MARFKNFRDGTRFPQGLIATIILLASSSAWAYPGLGTYTVPTSPELKAVATFDLKNLVRTGDDQNIQLSYDLPQDLTGATIQHIEMAGTVDPTAPFVTLKGSHAQASCLMSADIKMNCLTQYNDLTIDSGKVKDFLRNKFGNSPTLPSRIGVAGQFSEDPIGVVTYMMSPELPPGPALRSTSSTTSGYPHNRPQSH